MRGHVDGLWTIVLAAGGSSRLGRPKQFVRVRGRALLARTLATAQQLTPRRVIVVLGASRARARAVVRRNSPHTIVVANARWRDGMSGSLARGIAALPRRARAALLLTVDQPDVGARALRRLVARWALRPARPAAASYAGRLGVPAILTRRVWRDARRASGDVGAREVLRGNAGRVTHVALPEAAIDIDTQADLDAFTAGT